MYMILCRVNKRILSQFSKIVPGQNSIFAICSLRMLMKPKEPESDCNQVKHRLCEFLKKREEELSSTHENLQFIAVNQEGYYYSDEGLQGVWVQI